jgi:hypothetical protein
MISSSAELRALKHSNRAVIPRLHNDYEEQANLSGIPLMAS